MNLLISDSIEPRSLDEYRISLEDFGDKTFHPFIATNNWDLITLEVCDKTPKGFIQQLLPLAGIAVILTQDEITVHQVQVLSEVFPDSSAIIKKTYISKDFDKLRELVNNLSRKV